jgi:hypothetical protein
MGTSLSEVYDVFMMTITDYRLIDLFNSSQQDFENYLQAWLKFAISDFGICDQSLEFDSTTNEFLVTLKDENKIILSKLMTKYWLQKAVNDVTQFNLHVTDRDFKVASEAQNLREKVAYLNVVKEDCSQRLQDYGYKRVPWSDWFNQEYQGV